MPSGVRATPAGLGADLDPAGDRQRVGPDLQDRQVVAVPVGDDAPRAVGRERDAGRLRRRSRPRPGPSRSAGSTSETVPARLVGRQQPGAVGREGQGDRRAVGPGVGVSRRHRRAGWRRSGRGRARGPRRAGRGGRGSIGSRRAPRGRLRGVAAGRRGEVGGRGGVGTGPRAISAAYAEPAGSGKAARVASIVEEATQTAGPSAVQTAEIHSPLVLAPGPFGVEVAGGQGEPERESAGGEAGGGGGGGPAAPGADRGEPGAGQLDLEADGVGRGGPRSVRRWARPPIGRSSR